VSLAAGSQRALLTLARSAVETAVGGTAEPGVVEDPVLFERRGAFVTLRKRTRLRGCIGRVEPDAPLGAMLPDVARLAALHDPRFPPVVAAELSEIRIEISLLSVPAPVTAPSEIAVGRDGLIVAASGRRGLLLPQVAVEYEWTVEQFLEETCRKAGLSPEAWREERVRVLSFQAEVFAETE